MKRIINVVFFGVMFLWYVSGYFIVSSWLKLIFVRLRMEVL